MDTRAIAASAAVLVSAALFRAELACTSSYTGERPSELVTQHPRALIASFEPDTPGVLVLFGDDVPPGRHLDLAHGAGAEVLYRYRTIPALYVRDGEGDQPALVARLRRVPGVTTVRADRPLAAPAAAPLPAVPPAHGGVAIVDSGVAAHHDLRLGSRCFSAFRTGACDDPVGHGTHLARTATAEDATIYPVRVLSADLSGSEATLLAGLDWVAANANLVDPRIRVVVSAVPVPSTPLFRAATRALARTAVDLRD